MDLKGQLSQISDITIYENEQLSKHCGYGVGGNADYFIEVGSFIALNSLISLAIDNKVKYKVIGNGTNILFSDNTFNGIIISTNKLNDVFFKRDEVYATCGVSIEKLINFSINHSLTGLENLAGIPASLGGAIVMNAGAFGATISDFITSVDVLENGKIVNYSKEMCSFSYRNSKFLTNNQVVLAGTFKLLPDDRCKIYNAYKLYKVMRKNIQPQGRSCGSVFKNTNKFSAGKLIEDAGLKGTCIGGAIISEKHANFIITKNGATAKDVYSLICLIKKKVFDKFGINLCEEIELVGEF